MKLEERILGAFSLARKSIHQRSGVNVSLVGIRFMKGQRFYGEDNLYLSCCVVLDDFSVIVTERKGVIRCRKKYVEKLLH